MSPSEGTDIVSQMADRIAVARDPGRIYDVLRGIDLIFLTAALVVVAVLGVAARRRRVPLSFGRAPRLPNRIHEDAIALVVAGYFVGYLVAAGVAQLIWGSVETLPARMLTATAAPVAGIVGCLVVAGSRFEHGVAGFLGVGSGSSGRSSGLLVVVLVVMALGLCPLVGDGTVMLILRFSPDYPLLTHPTIDALHDPGRSVPTVVALWISAAVVAPIAEELFFRGLLQTFLVNLFARRWLAVATASVVFGAVHFAQPHAIAALILLGLLLGYAYERTGSLIPAILIHALFNLKTLVWDAIAPASS